MPVNQISPSNAHQMPVTEPQQPAGKAPQTPKDNTAAQQAPNETKSAILYTFGSVKEPNERKREPGASPASPSAPAIAPKLAMEAPAAPADQTSDASNYPIAQDANGNPLYTPDGLSIVHDPHGNKVARDAANNIVTDAYGNPKALSETGEILPNVVYDRGTGNKVIVDERYGTPVRTDLDSGKFTLAVDDKGGGIGIYDSNGNTVELTDHRTPGGERIFRNPTTGELQTGGQSGAIYKIDPATMDIARDADGKVLPPLYNPVDSDTTRPPVQPNDNPATTIANLPQSDSRGDPMQIKNTMIDAYGNLNPQSVTDALGSNDPRDVYDALVNNSSYGGWNGLEKDLPSEFGVVHPDQGQAKEIAAAMIAWQKENGKYNPLKANHLPPVVGYDAATKGKMEDYIKNNLSGKPRSPVFLDMSSGKSSGSIAADVFNGLTKSQVSDAFFAAYKDTAKDSGAFDIVSEYLANNWTGKTFDSVDDRYYKDGFVKLEDAVRQLGNGDRDAGLDKLKRAYFGGDASVIDELKKSFPPSQQASDYRSDIPWM